MLAVGLALQKQASRARIGAAPVAIFDADVQSVFWFLEVCLTVANCLFKDTLCNVRRATNPCAITYACARIRRLVHLVANR